MTAFTTHLLGGGSNLRKGAKYNLVAAHYSNCIIIFNNLSSFFIIQKIMLYNGIESWMYNISIHGLHSCCEPSYYGWQWRTLCCPRGTVNRFSRVSAVPFQYSAAVHNSNGTSIHDSMLADGLVGQLTHSTFCWLVKTNRNIDALHEYKAII